MMRIPSYQLSRSPQLRMIRSQDSMYPRVTSGASASKQSSQEIDRMRSNGSNQEAMPYSQGIPRYPILALGLKLFPAALAPRCLKQYVDLLVRGRAIS